MTTQSRRGLARAVKAASIVALAGEGVRTFGTGGAQVNAASIGMNESLGYVVEERWVTLRDPSEFVDPSDPSESVDPSEPGDAAAFPCESGVV